jgi:hypothetical protein
MNAISKTREGEPIADQFSAQFFNGHSAILALADGCGWGSASREAAIIASDTLVEYCKQNMKDVKNTRFGARMLLRAFRQAHSNILKGKSEQMSCGTTTVSFSHVFSYFSSFPVKVI